MIENVQSKMHNDKKEVSKDKVDGANAVGPSIGTLPI